MAPNESQLHYTGVTCLSEYTAFHLKQQFVVQDNCSSLYPPFSSVGLAKCSKKTKGISFPSSDRKDFHAVFFPTGPDEQCFQFHFPVPEAQADKLNWGNLSQTVGQDECRKLAIQLRAQGWHDRFLEPLENVTHAVRVGFALLEPKLSTWVRGRIVLCGDAAHPPVPYVGQGAQQGMEDVGVCVTLLKHYCFNESTKELEFTNFGQAMTLYQKIRVKRSGEMLAFSKELGSLQASRSGRPNDQVQEVEHIIMGDILMYGTLPLMFHGADHDYKRDADAAIDEEQGIVRVSQEEAMAAYEALFYGDNSKQESDNGVSADEALAAFEALHLGIDTKTHACDGTASPRSSLIM